MLLLVPHGSFTVHNKPPTFPSSRSPVQIITGFLGAGKVRSVAFVPNPRHRDATS